MIKIEIFLGLILTIPGLIILFVNTLFLKKGKILIFPWRKAMLGRNESWWIERDNLEDWPLFQNYIIINYIFSIAFIVIGILFLLGLIHF
jgi:hypothetical protein